MNYTSIIIVGLLVFAVASYYFMQPEGTQEQATPETAQEQMQTETETTETEDDEVPEGMHRMPDGTLMDNDAMLDMSVEGEASMTVADDEAETKVFTITGQNFAYDMEEIRVQEGDTVTINFESSDGYHDWVVDEFDAATERVNPGTPTSVTFVADKAGTYEFYCSVGSHRAQGMVGALIVE